MAAALALTAAGCSTQSDKPVIRTELVVPKLPAELREECERPVSIPRRRLSEKDVVVLWGADRKELVSCRARHKAVVGAIGLPVPR